MKFHLSKQVYDQLPIEDRRLLTSTSCECRDPRDGSAADECPICGGVGTIWEWQLSAEDSAAIQANLRAQGVPLGKIGTN